MALKVLEGLSHRASFSARALDELFQSNPRLNERDRAFINQLVQGVVRWRIRLDWIIGQAADFPLKRLTPRVLNILRLALFQIFFLDRVPESAAVNEAVKQAKQGQGRHVVSFVNGILRSICRQKEQIRFPHRGEDPVSYLALFYSYPEWLVKKWLQEWGPDVTEALLSAGNQIPTLTIRTNILRVERSELLRRLGEEGLKGTPTPYSPAGIILEGFRGRLDHLRPFKEGLFQVQDEAAQITTHLLSPQPGETILDVCAGVGGKSTHLAELMGDRGRIVALDINLKRLISLGRATARLGIKGISPVVGDASRSPFSLFHDKFDGIMVDAPCSGLGVISRRPDIKWNKSGEDVARLAQLQQAILVGAASLLRDGGRMLYVTCTISRDENDGTVEALLSHRRDIILEDMRKSAPAWGRDLMDDQGLMRTFPHRHHMDGFFAALFRKK